VQGLSERPLEAVPSMTLATFCHFAASSLTEIFKAATAAVSVAPSAVHSFVFLVMAWDVASVLENEALSCLSTSSGKLVVAFIAVIISWKSDDICRKEREGVRKSMRERGIGREREGGREREREREGKREGEIEREREGGKERVREREKERERE